MSNKLEFLTLLRVIYLEYAAPTFHEPYDIADLFYTSYSIVSYGYGHAYCSRITMKIMFLLYFNSFKIKKKINNIAYSYGDNLIFDTDEEIMAVVDRGIKKYINNSFTEHITTKVRELIYHGY